MAGVVATTFVSEAASKIVSSVIGSLAGTSARIAVSLFVNVAVVFQPQHAAGAMVTRDGVIDGGIHFRQFIRVKSARKELRRENNKAASDGKSDFGAHNQ